MIILCEPQCVGFEHCQVNSAFIAVVHEAFPGEELLFLAEEGHLEQVRSQLEQHNVEITYQQISLPERSLSSLGRYGGDSDLVRTVFETCERIEAERIVFCSITCPLMIAIKRLLPSYPRIGCLAIPHGLLRDISRPPIRLAEIPFWFRFWFSHFNNDRLQFLVYGQPILDELVSVLPHMGRYASALDHPYFYQPTGNEVHAFGERVKFGFFGVVHRGKGTDAMHRLADDIDRAGLGDRSLFTLIGYLNDKRLDHLLNSRLNIPSAYKPLDREAFSAYAKEIDYSVFLYRPSSYRLTASGAFFDALSYVKPLIALKNPFFKHYFNRFGDIGYLCSSYAEVRDCVTEVIRSKPEDRYREQCRNILAAREEMGIPRLANRFRVLAATAFHWEP